MSSALTLFSYMSTTQTSWSGRASLGGLEITAGRGGMAHGPPPGPGFRTDHSVADGGAGDLHRGVPGAVRLIGDERLEVNGTVGGDPPFTDRVATLVTQPPDPPVLTTGGAGRRRGGHVQDDRPGRTRAGGGSDRLAGGHGGSIGQPSGASHAQLLARAGHRIAAWSHD